MIKFENTDTYGWDAAIRGMRNPLNSWDKSDSYISNERCDIGENDLALMKKLVAAGSDHRKFMRMITVTVDITAPLYWWKQFDTYKVGTVANSCSTMHTIHKNKFTLDDFSTDGLEDIVVDLGFKPMINALNVARDLYNETGDKAAWLQMIKLMPMAYNQKRTVQMNYEVLRNIYHSRQNHKLYEWHMFCDWIVNLPYSELIIED